MTDRERIYNLVDKVCDLSIKAIDKITELKQENSKLKQRVAELEKPKKKRKFRAMTVKEDCDKVGDCKKCSYCFDTIFCDYMKFNGIVKMKTSVTPYKTKDGKYIFIEDCNTEVKNE